jgi:hypothetical protein
MSTEPSKGTTDESKNEARRLIIATIPRPKKSTEQPEPQSPEKK